MNNILSSKPWMILFISYGLISCATSNPIDQNDSRLGSNNQAKPKTEISFNSMITAMFEDSNGRMWIGSHCDGLTIYDTTSMEAKIKYITVENGLPGDRTTELYDRKVYLGNSIRGIQEDTEGRIWIETGDGICFYNGNKFTSVEPQKAQQTLFEFAKGLGSKSGPNWETFYDYPWFKDFENQGVFYFDGKALNHLIFSDVGIYNSGKLSQQEQYKYAVYSLYKDSQRNIWVGTSEYGVYKINESGILRVNEGLPEGIVRAFYEDSKDRIWISNVLYGLQVYRNLNGKPKLTNFTKDNNHYTLSETRSDPSLDSGRLLDGVQTIVEDANGTMWFGTYSDGVWRYDGLGFTHYTKANGLPDDCVKTIYISKSGELIFGIGELKGALYIFDGNKFVKKKLNA